MTTTVPHRREALLAREVAGEVVVLDLEARRMHTLNATAAFIFEEIDGRRTAEEIACSLAEAFDVDRCVAERDTEGLLDRLRELEIVL
ncbi:MAG: PqqD family protein [Planctomycetes bacterium]|nr:PqqD family protein [Planctomycetota bacterium]